MTFPKLNLKKNFCYSFEIEIAARLSSEIYSKMLGARIFENFREKEPNLFIKKYRIDKTEYTMSYLAFWPTVGKSVLMINHFEYRPGKAELQGREPIKVNFNKLYSFFRNIQFDCQGSATAKFKFPLSKFSPIIDLPYSQPSLLTEKKIEIRGVDLIVESKEKKYWQSISLTDELIYQKVGILNIEEKLSQQLIKNVYQEATRYAKELIRTKKGSKK